jgi:predicted methyltransferase
MGPLLTERVHTALRSAFTAGKPALECSLDLGRSRVVVELGAAGFVADGRPYPWLDDCRERTVYHWTAAGFAPVARFSGSLVKLVPTDWGPPTFEIDGIKMLPTAQVSPWEDARDKVRLVRPAGRRVLDTCGGLGYFAAWCLAEGALEVRSFERNPDVVWLRNLNPWSPQAERRLQFEVGDVSQRIHDLPTAGFAALLHDPPRFGIAGELYSQAFYDQLARVLAPGGRLFHYPGAPNRVSRGRDLPAEVARRLQRAGFHAKPVGDGVLGVRDH